MNPWRIRRLAVTSSTNDDAKASAEAGEGEGLVIHALSQTSGRGRHGRVWHSPEGNLYCSVLLRPQDARHYGHYSFVAALALADTVQKFLAHAEVTLKWPNDVLVGGKKISGILLEAGEGYLILGMGLNIRHHPDAAMVPATSLHSCGFSSASFPRKRESSASDGEHVSHAAHGHAPLDPRLRGDDEIDVILETLLDCLRHWHEILKKDGFAPVRSAWLERAQKGRLSVRLPDGTAEGDFAGIDADGHLILRLADGSERVIATGDVFFAS